MTKRNVLRRTALLLVAGVLTLGLAACGGSSGTGASGEIGSIEDFRTDISKGKYLSESDYKNLSTDEALEYCEMLAQEIDIQNDNAMAANSMMSDLDSEISDLKKQLADARSSTSMLQSEVNELEARLKELSEVPRSYTVVEGDWLMKIARKNRIYGDGAMWPRIFRANKDKIRDPNLIYPGQVFLIPRGRPSQHMVQEGETLARIAGYQEIYGSRGQWERIFEANRDKIGNPNMIRPGMTLDIPR